MHIYWFSIEIYLQLENNKISFWESLFLTDIIIEYDICVYPRIAPRLKTIDDRLSAIELNNYFRYSQNVVATNFYAFSFTRAVKNAVILNILIVLRFSMSNIVLLTFYERGACACDRGPAFLRQPGTEFSMGKKNLRYFAREIFEWRCFAMQGTWNKCIEVASKL